MDQPSKRGMPTSYVKKDGAILKFCGGGAPVVGLAAATRAGGQLKRTEDNTPKACAIGDQMRFCVPATQHCRQIVRPAH